eukprot:g12361.t1
MHGTSPDGALGITDSGFRLDLTGSHAGTMYSSAGEGIYEGVYAMLLCRVCCGQMLRMLRPDPALVQQAIATEQASAVLGDREASVGTYREFVVFDSSQVYPEYVEISGVNIGRMIFKLYDNICPKTAENFRCLCNGERGTGLITKMPLNIQGSKFHRVIPEMDFQSERALYNILEPRYHYLVPEWMKTASDAEKRGVIKLARIAEPKLLKAIGRPRSDAFEPMLKEHNWYFKRGNPCDEPKLDTIEKFPVDASEYQVPSWMHEDLYEAEQIPKPGGCILKLKEQNEDSINIMRQKNWTRNQGTYHMFSGSFDGATTTASCYTMEAIGLAPLAQPE